MKILFFKLKLKYLCMFVIGLLGKKRTIIIILTNVVNIRICVYFNVWLGQIVAF